MSKQGIFQNIKERLWKPSKKRQKLQDEDDWCDALEHLSLDSDDEYFDASEQQVTRRQKKIAHGKELSENKFEEKSEMHQPSIRPFTAPSTSGVRSRRKYYGETSEERQRQIFQRHLHSGDFQFGTRIFFTSPPMETEPYHFATGGSNTATSSSSEAGVQVGFKRLTTIHDPPQEHLMEGNTGGIPDSTLEKLTKALPGVEYRIALSLGLELGFSPREIYECCGYGNPKYSSGILRMLRAWKDRTPHAKQMSGLLEALRKANLKHLADYMLLQEDSTSLVPLPRAGDPPTIEINPEQPATTDGKSGKAYQEDKSTGLLGWFGHILCWLGNSFLLFLLFGWLPWLSLRKRPTRKARIYLCTSSGIWSIHGLKEKLHALSDSSRCVVQDLELPYNRLEEFKFPSEVDKSDAMILCHSVHNRGFSITDVQDSIYDEFLKYCNQFFGKYHVVVVVHDYNFNKEALKGQMETFQSMQPTTFKMTGLVVLAGELDDTVVQLFQDDLAQQEQFVMKFC